MKKRHVVWWVIGVLMLLAVAVLLAPVRKTVLETFIPTPVNQGPVSKVSRTVYLEDESTLIIYFSDRPRMDYYNFPKAEYEALQRAEDQSAYYFQKIHGQYKAY